ncbi:fluoride efflux transporter CrcB [Aurantiacibacter flavus]|uniref:Fluoride-specific ion channel FluC n=1 Tax=Aurantiacibacter flavus TaxID=3145232 RepID=A0ABV0CUE1_9SPHN
MISTPPPLYASLSVALGGGIGALLRYQMGRALTHLAGPQTMVGFPWATLMVNVIGSLAMGVLAGWLARHGPDLRDGGEQVRLLVGVGLLGGFTTFSSFSLEMMLLMDRGDNALAFVYGSVSIMAGLAGLYIGLIVMRLFG